MCERKHLAQMTSKIFWALTFYFSKIINDIHKKCNNRQKLMTTQAQKQQSTAIFHKELCWERFT